MILYAWNVVVPYKIKLFQRGGNPWFKNHEYHFSKHYICTNIIILSIIYARISFFWSPYLHEYHSSKHHICTNIICRGIISARISFFKASYLNEYHFSKHHIRTNIILEDAIFARISEAAHCTNIRNVRIRTNIRNLFYWCWNTNSNRWRCITKRTLEVMGNVGNTVKTFTPKRTRSDLLGFLLTVDPSQNFGLIHSNTKNLKS